MITLNLNEEKGHTLLLLIVSSPNVQQVGIRQSVMECQSQRLADYY